MGGVITAIKNVGKVVQDIGNFFSTVIDFVISFVEDVVYVIKLTAETVAKIPDYFDWLPSSVVAIIVSAFAIVVIYKVLGREG